MSNTEKEEKLLKFKGIEYVAIPEIVPHGCKGCALEDKGCYNSIRALAICRQGFIFKKKKEED